MDFQRTFQTGFLFSALTSKNKKPDYFSDSPTSGIMFLEESVGRRERNIFSRMERLSSFLVIYYPIEHFFLDILRLFFATGGPFDVKWTGS